MFQLEMLTSLQFGFTSDKFLCVIMYLFLSPQKSLSSVTYCKSNLMFQSMKLLRFCANQKLTREEDPVLYRAQRGNSHNSEPHPF